MAILPSTIIVESTDAKLTQQMLYEECHKLFTYKVEDIVLRGNRQVRVNLEYSPKTETLKMIFCKLPVKYFQTGNDDDEEIDILEDVMRRYHIESLFENEIPDELLGLRDD